MKTITTLIFIIIISIFVLWNAIDIIRQDREIEELRAKFESGEIEIKGDTDIVDVEPPTQEELTICKSFNNIYKCKSEKDL